MLTRLRIQLALWLQLPKTIIFIRWFIRLTILVFIMDTGYLIGIWPQWQQYSAGPILQSSFIRSYIYLRHENKNWPDLKWKPVPISSISPNMVRALIIAEDARFYTHSGIDMDALQQAMEYNLSEQRIVYGASTISQQTVKNIFLSPSRNPLRKWHELLLTLGMEQHLSKRRILELYLNLAEFGRGIYGVEAAAQYYWGIPASRLTPSQAVQLAASLPAPVKHNPSSQTRFFKQRIKKISRYF
ncbi:MAG: monofunctional biosynthetic peptidoglycan transglycosylase [Gammaproteobacteria bacterium]|nr:monofunctional biosynthetic peptidoglycan transglycosylase [Gammaproteobacteria bacterium]